MLAHTDAEKRVKTLQKKFLCWIEENPDLYALEPNEFNEVRKKVIRTTFDAFRLGFIGLNGECREGLALWQHYFGWYENNPHLENIDREILQEIIEESFRVLLEAFRLGTIVSTNEALE